VAEFGRAVREDEFIFFDFKRLSCQLKMDNR
jgi:hypothetical protein